LDDRACIPFHGGEDEGIKRCKDYIWGTKAIGHYAETRNQIFGANYSSKLSPWLANGSLSPRYAYHEALAFEKKHQTVESTQKFIDELFWRDFCRYWCLRHGSKIFSTYGVYDKSEFTWKNSPETVRRWR